MDIEFSNEISENKNNSTSDAIGGIEYSNLFIIRDRSNLPLENQASAASNTRHRPRTGKAVEGAGTQEGRQLSRYDKWRPYIAQVVASNENPRFIAMGMAVGVFVGCTPTMPFNTVLAISLAFLLQGSKTAAVLGTWVCNPLTVPFLYLGSYKIGYWLLGTMLPFPFRYDWLPDPLESGIDITLLMVVGGIVIGIVPAIVSYFISFKVASAVKARKNLLKDCVS